MLARDVMTPSPGVIMGENSILQAAEMMRTLGIGMLPVVQDLATRRLIGVITDRDIVVRHVALQHGPSAKVRDTMTHDPLVTVRADTPISEIAERMSRWQVRRLPVLDLDGSVIGIVAQADLATRVGPSDPKLVESVLEGISRPGQLVP
jgi:CBS domain-containing protein